MKRTGNGHEAWVGSQLRASWGLLARYGARPVWVGFALRVLLVAAPSAHTKLGRRGGLRRCAGSLAACRPAGPSITSSAPTWPARPATEGLGSYLPWSPSIPPNPFLSHPIWASSCTSVRFLVPALVVIRASHPASRERDEASRPLGWSRESITHRYHTTHPRMDEGARHVPRALSSQDAWWTDGSTTE